MGLFDFLKSVKDDKPPASANLSSEVAIHQFFSNFTQFPDPDVILRKAGKTRQELKKICFDDEVDQALQTRLDALIGSKWSLNPVDFKGGFVEENLDPIMQNLIVGTWHALLYGYSVLELVYRTDGSKVVIDRAVEKPFYWFEPRNDGTLKFNQFGISSGEVVDNKFKFFETVRNKSYDNPYGEALLSRVYWPWFFKQNLWRFWMRYIERFGEPFVLGKSNNPTNFVDEIKKAGIENVISVGTTEDAEILFSTQRGEFDLIHKTLVVQIQKLVLGQTLTSDIQNRGSFAAAAVHENVRKDKLKSDMRLVTCTIQRIVNALVQINFPGETPPVFSLSIEQGLSIERSQRDAELARAKVVKFTPQYLMRNYDLKQGDFSVEDSPNIDIDIDLDKDGNAGGEFSKGIQQFISSRRLDKDQLIIDELVENSVQSAGKPINSNELMGVIKESQSPEELEENMIKFLSKKNVRLDRFQKILEQTLFAADLMGFVHAGQDQNRV